MRIALAQLNSIPGDFSGTVRHMLSYAERAARLGADVVIFPTTILSGTYPVGISESTSFELDMLDALEDFAARTPISAVVPAYVFDGDAGYTEVFLCADGTAGPLRLREMGRSGEDARIDETVAQAHIAGASMQFVVGDTGLSARDAAVDVIVVLSALPFCDEDSSTLLAPGLGDSSLQGLVAECPCAIAMLQGVGGYDDTVLAGGSFAASAEGSILAACPSFEEALVTFDIEPTLSDDAAGDSAFAPLATKETLSNTRLTTEPVLVGGPEGARSAAFPTLTVVPREEARPSGDSGVAMLVGVPVEEVPALSEPARTGLLWKALTLSVRDYVRKCGFSDVIVGLSGGIDSSVVAALAVDALGPEHVLGILMPGPYSSDSSVADATALAENLGIATRTVSIAGLYDKAAALFSEALGAPFEGVAAENLQARLRGTTLMSLANARGALVLNTGNKSESGMGYSTLYGDTVGAFAPLADVYKGRVYDLARWRNAGSIGPAIPENVLVKAPSAELSAGQTDEGSFGVSYPDIDQILTMHVERGMSAADIVGTGIDAASVQRVLDACRVAEFKRRQEPMGPVVSLKPFVDRAWPVVLGWRDRAVRPAEGEAPGQEEDAALFSELMSAPEGQDIDVGKVLLALAREANPVPDRLDAMLGRLVHRDQVVGMLGDVAYGASISGQGPDMDSALGLPLFSKN